MRLCTDEETKTQRDKVIYQISHTAQVTREETTFHYRRLLRVPIQWLQGTNLFLMSGNYTVMKRVWHKHIKI